MTPGLPLTPGEHEHSAAIDEAARWLAAIADPSGMAIVPEIRTRFGLTSLEAIEAIRHANQLRRRG